MADLNNFIETVADKATEGLAENAPKTANALNKFEGLRKLITSTIGIAAITVISLLQQVDPVYAIAAIATVSLGHNLIQGYLDIKK